MNSSGQDIIEKMEGIRKRIEILIDSFTANLENFTEGKELYKENSEDFKMIYGGIDFLKKVLNTCLVKEVLEEKINDPDFSGFLATARHDLRNPMNVIMGYSEIILEDFEQKFGSSDAKVIKLKENIDIIGQLISSISEIKINGRYQPLKLAVQTEEIAQEYIAEEQIQENPEFILFKKKFSILIVDDHNEHCLILERYLRRNGFNNIKSVNDGFQALDLANQFDLMLLDVDMPNLSGIEVLIRIKKEIIEQRLMVLMISGSDTMENTIKCIRLGAEDFLTKPFNPDLLRVRIDSCVEKAWFIQKEALFRQRIESEKKRYENLLNSIFPPSVVLELKQTGKVQTRYYQNVAILFADVVGFTSFCKTHPLTEVVASILEFAAMCERIAQQNNMQKIKTIGDCFLGVAGMLFKSENPTLDCIKCAEEFIRQTQLLSTKWQLHVGIHYGTVIGGFVGKQQYLFDIWGDAVNTAAHIQTLSEPNTIYISKTAWDKVKEVCNGTSLGDFPGKGKTPFEVFKYEGPKK